MLLWIVFVPELTSAAFCLGLLGKEKGNWAKHEWETLVPAKQHNYTALKSIKRSIKEWKIDQVTKNSE